MARQFIICVCLVSSAAREFRWQGQQRINSGEYRAVTQQGRTRSCPLVCCLALLWSGAAANKCDSALRQRQLDGPDPQREEEPGDRPMETWDLDIRGSYFAIGYRDPVARNRYNRSAFP